MRLRDTLVGHRWVNAALVALLTGAGPVRRVTAIHQGFGLRSAAVCLVVVAFAFVVTTERAGRAPLRWLIVSATSAAALGAVAGGRIVGIWLLGTTVLAAWVASDRTLGPLPRFDRRSLPPVLGLTLGSALAAGNDQHLLRALILWVLSCVAAVFFARRIDTLIGAGRWLRDNVTRGVSTAALIVVWVPFVGLPWLLQRVVRYDPLESPPKTVSSTLVTRADRPEDPERMWFADTARDRPSFVRRARRRVPTVLLLLVVAGALWFTQVRPATERQPRNAGLEELASGADFGELRTATDGAVRDGYLSHFVGLELPDLSSEFVNIAGGRRQTWRPSSCDGQPLSVWMFGGSTLFGLYHRDDHTIPSELARIAHRQGLYLDVQNFGVPGDVAWQMGRRLERELSDHEVPDVVIFYGGWNDLRAVRDMDFTGRSRERAADFIGPLDRLHQRVLTDLGGLESGRRYLVRVPEVGPQLPDRELLDLALSQHRSATDTVEALAERHGFDFVHTYQPSLYTRTPRLDDEPEGDPSFGKLLARFRDRLPDEVVDLADVFDGVDGLVYYDEVHVLEEANAAVATELWTRLEPALQRAADESGAGGCR